MDRLTVNGSTSYDVIIERDIQGRVGELLRDELGGEKALIVTDSNVGSLYLDIIADSTRDSGYETYTVALAYGDQTKNIDNYSFLLSVLADHEFSSTDLVIALGGGMIGDLAGFVAATYKRGTKCVLMPTSLLACVDASIGGKTAINLPSGKNQVGTIRNPSMVVVDPEFITTLSGSALQEGYAEIIKYGILKGNEIIDLLREAVSSGDYSDVIRQSILIKKSYVEADESDSDLRQFLNLGHLVGHAIEAHYEYRIRHGQAVAEGLAIEARCAAMSGFIEVSTYLAITALLEVFEFGISNTYSLDDLMPFMVNDKRIRDGAINLIIPNYIGDCTMRAMNASQLADYIRKGL